MVEYEWVRGSWRNKGYFRRRPYTRDHPTLAQRKVRYAVAKLAHEKATGKTGTVIIDGKECPVAAKIVKENLEGRLFAPPKTRPIPKILQEMEEVFIQVGKAVESAKPLNKVIIPTLLNRKKRASLTRRS